jgi:hypothetical protein
MSMTEYVEGIRLCCQNQPSGSSTNADAARPIRRRMRCLVTRPFYMAAVGVPAFATAACFAAWAAAAAAPNRMKAFTPWMRPKAGLL